MEVQKNETAIIISSCDIFADTWKAFFSLYEKYWPDCPYPIYLISNYQDYNKSYLNTIKVGEDKGWASNLKLALTKIDSDYIFYLQDDYFFNNKVNTKLITESLNMIRIEDVAYLRLIPEPPPDKQFKNYGNIGIIKKNTPYRVSLQAAIWNKNILNSLLVDGESGWDMEYAGSDRSNKYEQIFLCVKKPILSYYNAIVKGRWDYGVINFLDKNSIKVDTKLRKIEKRKTYLKRKLRVIPILGYFFKFIFLFTEKYKRIKNNV